MFLGHKELKRVVRLSLLAVLLCSCQNPQLLALAKVDDQPISATDLTIRLSQIPGFLKSSKSEQEQTAQAVLEGLIDDRLLYLEAQALQIRVSDAQVDHAIAQHRALLGDTLFAFFTNRKGMTQKRLKRFYQEQLSVLEYFKLIQASQKPFCASFDVQSSPNCIKRSDFMKSLRNKHAVVSASGALVQVLNQIGEGGQ
jgi:hypothetical protein